MVFTQPSLDERVELSSAQWDTLAALSFSLDSGIRQAILDELWKASPTILKKLAGGGYHGWDVVEGSCWDKLYSAILGWSFGQHQKKFL